MNKNNIQRIFIICGTMATISAGVISLLNGKGFTALYAHGAQLNISYDVCVTNNKEDLEKERQNKNNSAFDILDTIEFDDEEN